MSHTTAKLSRRRFFKTAAGASALVALPQFIPASVLGKDGAVSPSEQIVVGGIGIGNRGTYDLGCFLEQPDVRFAAVCDVKATRREAVKRMVDERYGDRDCATYRDLRELLARADVDAVLIATGPNWHATASMLAANAGKDVYCEKPCTRNIAQSLVLAETFRRCGRVFQAGTQRRNLPHVAFAVALARRGKLGKLHTVYAHPAGMATSQSGWATAEPEPPKDQIDWDLYLGPAAWRPFNHGFLDGFNFEKGGGMVGGGILEWGSHCVDLCQWAADADGTAPVEYHPPHNGEVTARYANGVKLVVRETGWLPLGSCPVRFEGDAGWVETGDSGRLIVSSPTLLAGRKVAEIDGYPATYHVRDFLNCVKSRAKPLCNADVACSSHIACHACNIAIFLNRQLAFNPRRNEFIGDDEANRLRSEAIRDPWRS
jgi:predicted dehydrogenase